MQVPPDTKYTAGSGVSIAYQVFGSGPPLLMAPAIPSHLDLMWVDPVYTQVLRRLGSFATVALYDPRGTGLSDPVDHVPTVEESADDIAAVLDAAGFDQAVLFAASTTCPGASVFAARAPERVTGLLLWGAWAQGLAATDDVHAIAGWDDQMAASMDRWREIVDQHWGQGFTLPYMAPGFDSERRRRSWGMLERASASPASIRAITQAAFEVDLREVYRLVSAPTVVVQASDGPQPEAIGRYVAELLPRGEFVVIPPSTEADDLAGWMVPVLDLLRNMVTNGDAPPVSDRTMATILFTDVVASTELASRLGDRDWTVLLERQEALLRDLVDAHGGRVVKMIGDGSLSVFDGPVRAVRCAASFVEAVRALDIEVRAGVHTGECEQVGHDLAGLTVHIAARVEAAAHPGEVWITESVRNLLVGSGIELRDRGEAQLKGVPGVWNLASLAGADTEPARIEPPQRATTAADRVLLRAARQVPGLLRFAGRLQRG
ncbi:MAG: putative aminoacrylate hydrolase RutD [Acidimicrobiales bacterium]|nr:putative aminoacrylate hydrolase RutD [Acidimicrobiales bacterium]